MNDLVIREPIMVPKTADRDADIVVGLKQVAEVLEQAIRESPGQWVLFQRVWPDDHREELAGSETTPPA
jgi:KDO2-lipid IV(A) lauroyltransferase